MFNMNNLLMFLCMFIISAVFAQNTNTTTNSTTPSISISPANTFIPVPTVQSTGFDSNSNQEASNDESWLKQHNRFVFIIFVGLLFLGLLIWYVVYSVKGMRKRLEAENAAQLYMMQQVQPQNINNRNDRIIPESIESPPPAYKTRENTPQHQQPQQQQ